MLRSARRIEPRATIMTFSTRQAALAAGALLCFASAGFLVLNAGLPERALFTGQIIEGERPTAPEIGALAPNFEAETPDGAAFRMADLRGSPVIVNFWATWCEPCRVEMPELQALYDANRARGLRVVGVNVGDAPEDVLDWVDNYGLTFDMALDPRGDISAQYLLRGQPTTFVVAPDGVITHIVYGPTTRSTLEAAVAPYLRS